MSENPYVGPQPFEAGETLYGREREITELIYRLNAERIVLLHSPSGAGKTSLVQAGLVPELEKSFDVRGPVRVNQEPAAAGVNRYVASVNLGFEEGIPEKLRRPAEELAVRTLAGYFAKRPRRRSAPRNVLLVFDQFEEVLTVDPLAVEAKRELFDQLGELLRNPRVWALFVLREDYLAPLDPYARQVPTQLKNRFRMDFLGLEAAREAMVRTADDGGRAFPAADQLVDDLATMKVQQADGSFVEETGRHVEPVQLQVVCLRLWDEMPADDPSIDPEDLEQFGDVTDALAAYYADSVARIAGGEPARERAIRDWFGEELITESGIRGQVLRGAGTSGGLANELIERLLDRHLIRAEKRAGATWYELAHDRLVEPVRDDNAAWREEHLSELQRRASLWDRQGRPHGLLLAGEALLEAERWAQSKDNRTTEPEEELLQRSQRAQAETARAQRQARWIRRLAIGATVTSVVAIAALFWAVRSYGKALDMARRAFSRQLAMQSSQLLDKQLDLALLLALEADRVVPTVEARASLLAALNHNPRLWRFLHGRGGPIKTVALSPDSRTLAAASDHGDLLLWDVASGRATQDLPERLPGILDPTLAFSPDGRWLAVGGMDEQNAVQGKLGLWDVSTSPPRPRQAPNPGGRINDLTFCGRSEDAVLAWATKSGVRLWRLTGESEPWALPARGEVQSLAFNSDCTCLAGGYELLDGPDLWDLTTAPAADRRAARCRTRTLQGPAGHVTSLAFHPEGQFLATARKDGEIQLWDLDASKVETLGASAGPLDIVVFSADGATLAAAGGDGIVALWDMNTRRPAADPLVGHDGPVYDVALSHDGALVASAGRDGRVLLWRPDRRHRLARTLVGHGDEVWSVALSPDGRGLVSGSGRRGRTVRLWDTDSGRGSILPLPEQIDGTPTVAFSTDGASVAAGNIDGSLHRWRVGAEAGEGRHWLTPNHRPVRRVAFGPDSSLLASTVGKEILLWDLTQHPPREERRFTHSGNVWEVLFLGDAQALAASDETGQIVLWQLATGDQQGQLSPHDEPVNHILSALAESPDGTLLAAASRDKNDRCVYLWQMPKGKFLGCLPGAGHETKVTSLAFAHTSFREGRILVSADLAGELIVWDVDNRQEIGRLRGGHEQGKAINDLSVSSEGQTLASAGDDHAIVVWDFDWHASACEVAGRSKLSDDEWRDYVEGGPKSTSLCPPSEDG